MSDSSLFNLTALDAESSPTTVARASAPIQSQSLYRKYRPQTFAEDDLFGQEHVVNTLRNAIALNRIAHAYLFCGPRGTGKTTSARLLAKAVNCLDPDPYKRPCNVCASCVAINTGATTDVIEIDAASNRGIDDIRDLRERVKYAPTQLRTKFYIIDEAHQITGAAANAFLKTLEEPPAHTKFVLATTDPEELLQTIVSRCQRFDFRRINSEAMQACIRKVSTLEHIDIDDAAVLAIARHTTGSLRDALGLLDQVAVYRENDQAASTTVTLDLVRTVLGVSRNDRVEGILRALADRDPGAGLNAIGAAVDAGEDMRQLGRQLVAYIRLLLLQRAGGSSDADDVAVQLAERFTLNELADLAKLFADIDYKVKHATLSQLPLELAIVEGALRGTTVTAAAQPSPQTAPAIAPPSREIHEEWVPPTEPERIPDQPRPSLRDRVRGADRSASPAQPRNDALRDGSATVSSSRPERPTSLPRETQEPPRSAMPNITRQPTQDSPAAPTSARGNVSLDAIVDLWPKIRADVKAVNRRIEALLQQIDPVAVVNDKLILVSAYEFHRNRVNADEARIIIEDVVSRLMGRQLSVSCVTRDEARQLTESRPSAAPSTQTSSPTRSTAPAAAPAATTVAPDPTPVEVRTRPAMRSTDRQPSRNSDPSPDWAPPPFDEPPLDPYEYELMPSRPAPQTARSSAQPPVERAENPEAGDANSTDLDAERLKYAKNIFDAEEIRENEPDGMR